MRWSKTLGEALGYFQAAETTARRLLKAEPEAARSWRHVSESLGELDDFLASRVQSGDAEKAPAHYQRLPRLGPARLG